MFAFIFVATIIGGIIGYSMATRDFRAYDEWWDEFSARYDIE